MPDSLQAWIRSVCNNVLTLPDGTRYWPQMYKMSTLPGNYCTCIPMSKGLRDLQWCIDKGTSFDTQKTYMHICHWHAGHLWSIPCSIWWCWDIVANRANSSLKTVRHWPDDSCFPALEHATQWIIWYLSLSCQPALWVMCSINSLRYVRYSKVAHIRGFFSSYLRFLCPQCIGSF